MALPHEQTPLLRHGDSRASTLHFNTKNSSNATPDPSSFYDQRTRLRTNSENDATYASAQLQHNYKRRPSAQRRPLLIQQTTTRAAHRHEQAHAITARHWLVLLLACMIVFGNYYCYDIPAALNVQLREWLGTDDGTHQYQLNLLYAVYSLPNIVLPLLGGYLIDRLSASRMLILFSLCICLGQGIFSMGISLKSIGWMVLGRFIFGIGGECLEVAQAKITTDWFKSRWLGFALGLNLSSARLATALNDNVSPLIAKALGRQGTEKGKGVIAASWVGFGVCGLCLICGFFLAHLDQAPSRTIAGVRLDTKDRKARDEALLRSRKDNIVGRTAISVSSDSTMTLSSVALEEEEELEKEEEMAEDDQMLWSEVFTLQTNFWILCLCCISLYGSVVPFNHIASDFLQRKWRMDATRAGSVMSIPDIVSSIGSPLCGYLVDCFGNRARYIPLSAVFIICAHFLFGFTMFTPIVGMIILGFAYSLFASVLWPCIPFLVKDHQLGTAYGLVTIALNISLTFFPMMVASILAKTKGSYQTVEGSFIVLAVVALGLSALLNLLDYRQGGSLQLNDQESGDLQSSSRLLEEEEEAGQLQRHHRYDPREPGFEYRRQRRYSQDLLWVDRHGGDTGVDSDLEDDQNLVTTKSVGEGIITIIPHRRRHSTAGFTGHLERARLRARQQHGHRPGNGSPDYGTSGAQ
ncbi:hypothetical protein EMPS_08644 [Entomortierella parvispora]|uniref:Lysosomal dipeptide transporter MFSD1 n=1 Tax=Entomortierella parvispora TaxID=205924 RepID=A0A9P3LZT7_9FUNG|nr:hypothetical protein EMPS_08644 [Entomortierella parvispora]